MSSFSEREQRAVHVKAAGVIRRGVYHIVGGQFMVVKKVGDASCPGSSGTQARTTVNLLDTALRQEHCELH